MKNVIIHIISSTSIDTYYSGVFCILRFCEDIELMIGYRPNAFWLICWRYGGPFAMAIIFISSLIEIGNKGTVYEAWDTAKVLFKINHKSYISYCARHVGLHGIIER